MSDLYHHYPLGEGTAELVTPAAPSVTLNDVADHLLPLLAGAGHLLLRDFSPTMDDFNKLVQRCSGRITLDPARTFYGDVAQNVDSGVDALGLHIENGATPSPPDLLWFHCVRAASRGSRTTVCDGQRVWDRLGPDDRALFGDRQVVYSRRVSEEHWRPFIAFSLNDGRGAAEVTPDDLRHLPGTESTTVTEHADGSITYAYRTYAAHTTRWSDRMAWANSIFGPSYNYEPPDIRFADGGEIPSDALDRLRKVTEDVTEEIDWRDGDVVLIDNSRVMHGRRAILDSNRMIVNAQSFIPQL
ncbi:TauD/TfdA family dioxygenase [Streptomyces afghaniensis]|uniref:TauD/TfdA family dioxygenase n=1 Tax=Streptomyces afghaniensis TaxID=66865 RepID=UPI002789B410|nr:TauD/TfdA family dioxygenase [Streptomyces afghaniensis]MDQ1018914.1 alpha-ketoglutarate-dependent taurine dioxygenase [Streptomyces afghaniensis]